MSRGKFDKSIFLLEGLNALATGFYFNYLFFFLKEQFAFTNMQNLLVCALNGLVFAPGALWGGRFGQKHGYMNAFVLGSALMALCMAACMFLASVLGLLTAMVLWTIGMCFTWPNLEALISDHQNPIRLPAVLGIYNVVWSGGSAVAYFFGGAVAENLGWKSIFWIPAVIHLVQVGLALSLRTTWRTIASAPRPATVPIHESHPHGPLFLKMAWIANPFAYIAINAIIPLIPDVANKFNLSPKLAGFFCSVWLFSRMFTFVVLALWPGWHYRFGYLIQAYVGMLFCFAGILLLESFWSLIAVQIVFGWCIGLIYYSSLYYSMHVGETKGEHGGVHEAVIGLGIFGGPAMGAASIAFFPAQRGNSVIGVAFVLGAGLATLLLVGRKRRLRARPVIAS